ncbi:MAG: hypothetical protein WA683_23130, partial [Pseudolabrys sp.]
TLGGMIIKHHLAQSRSSNSAASNALSDVSDVRFGSKADMCNAKRHVRFTPESRHVQCNSACPLSANSGHSRS